MRSVWALAFLSLGLCLVGFVTNTAGYSFRQGQQAVESLPFRRKTSQQTPIPNKAYPSRVGTRHTLSAPNHWHATGQGGFRCMVPIVFICR
jgi:hypothetical protein